MAVKSAKTRTKTIPQESLGYPKAHIVKEQDSLDLWQQNLSLDQQTTYQKQQLLRLEDITWRLTNRENFRKFLIALLIGQNIAVFGLVTTALYLNRLEGLQLIFSILVTGTLLETASMIFFIIKWLFSEIRYEDKNTISFDDLVTIDVDKTRK